MNKLNLDEYETGKLLIGIWHISYMYWIWNHSYLDMLSELSPLVLKRHFSWKAKHNYHLLAKIKMNEWKHVLKVGEWVIQYTYVHTLLPCPSIGPKLFWTRPNCFAQTKCLGYGLSVKYCIFVIFFPMGNFETSCIVLSWNK